MYHVSAQCVDERMINVHYYYYYFPQNTSLKKKVLFLHLSQADTILILLRQQRSCAFGTAFTSWFQSQWCRQRPHSPPPLA